MLRKRNTEQKAESEFDSELRILHSALPSQPEITVLITAHNEAERIQPCLRSVVGQDYPMERVEILLVDDRSDDGTAEMARQLGIDSLRILRLDEPLDRLTSRQTALDMGFREARGEIVLVMDAGGRAPREWIRELTGHLGFRDGAVTAPAIFAGGQPFIARYQTLELLFMFTLQRWVNSHGRPAGLLGANMAVRREAYLETGGFPAIGFALAEDQALGQALERSGWSLRYLNGPATQNPAGRSFEELLARARRRATLNAPMAQWVIFFMMISNIAAVVMGILGMMNLPAQWGGLWVLLLILRYGAGLLLISLSAAQYGSYNLLQWVWLFEPLLTIQWLAVFVSNLVKPEWEWGGLRYVWPKTAHAQARTKSVS